MVRLPPSSQASLDMLERLAIVVVFSHFAARHGAAALDGAWISLLLLLSEGAIVAFVLVRRRATSLSLKPLDWACAAFGTLLPLLARPADGQMAALLPVALCGVIMFTGIALQIQAKLSLRRSFGLIAANRGVVVGGPYRLVRHPMYLGYLVTHIGLLMAVPTLWNLSIYAMALAFQLARIASEERLLMADASYRAFHRVVRYRLLPGVY